MVKLQFEHHFQSAICRISSRLNMAPIKRKAESEDRPGKKPRAEGKEHGSEKDVVEKRSRKAGLEADSDKKDYKQKGTDKKKGPVKSVLQEEERAFPRGGASVLTPIEHRQIKAQAERDVLFEQETGQKAEPTDDDGNELFAEADAAPATSAKRKRKTTGQKNDSGLPQVEGSGVAIGSLSYKSVVVGSTVLGRVTAITGKDVALALPNNLTGYAPITALSDRLNARIEKLLADDTNAESGDEEEDIDLKKLFHQGQWLRASVTATATESTEPGAKSKKHIQLSLNPTSVNGGLADDSIPVNTTVQAAVRSVEDHGLVMDVGLADESVRGFVSKKDLGSAYTLSHVQEGQLMLCLVTGKGSNGKVLKLSPDFNKLNAALPGTKQPVLSDAPTVDAFLPGTAVDILITDSGDRGIVGKVMGMLDVTADVVHSNAVYVEDMSKKYKVGSKTKARIIYAVPQDDGSRRVGVSLLDHVLALTPSPSTLPEASPSKLKSQAAELDQTLPSSSIVDDAKILKVSPDRGLYIGIPFKSGRDEQTIAAYAHISQIADTRIDSLSTTTGAFKPDSTHKIRILAYNAIDNIYYVSLKKSVLEQAFLKIEDLPIGDIVKGSVDKLILGGARGITGVLIKLSDSITGLVPEMHLSDAQLQHPERKFKEGFPVKARILSVDTEKRHVRLTLKKSLVDDVSDRWQSYDDLKPGMESKGTIVNTLPHGAAVQFFGPVRAWLPVAEMSETFIESPEKHFRIGQTVTVKILSVNPETQEMKVTCKDSSDFSSEQQSAWQKISGGDLVSGTVTVKTVDAISIDLEGGLKGTVRIGHLVDASAAKAESAMKRIRVGQTLSNLLVLDKQERSRTIVLSNKPSMIEDAKADKLVTSFVDVQQGNKVHGFVRNISPDGVYAEFANGVVGLMPKSQISVELLEQPSFGLRKDQTLSVWISGVDQTRERFLLTMRGQAAAAQATKSTPSERVSISNPIDSKITSMDDFTLGKVVKARVASVKATQINVLLADKVQGRVDVSEMFDSWEDIANKASPLQSFKANEIIDVKILGIHDARNHRFLPISHRAGRVPVFELSAKKSRVESGDDSLLSLDSIKPGASHLAFINNHGDNCVWVNLSPNVRGRVALMDLSDDVGQLQNVENRFRVGCALRVTVKAVDMGSNRLDLTARQNEASPTITLKDLLPGMVLPARVTRSNERTVTVELADNIICHVPLVELGDDYDQINPGQYNKNDIVRACVIAVDQPNKRAFVSLRPSKVLSSSLPVKDTQIANVTQLKAGDLVRGFVKKVAEKGIFVSLGANVDALVRISDLSDQFVKDWRSIHEIDQLVKGRVLAVDAASKQIQLSLKMSHVGGEYEPPLSISDLEVGMIVTGKVRKVEDFGAFIDIDNTQPRLSGLCHRSEVAAKRVEDVRKLYSAGDVVKAKVLDVNVEDRKISLGLKASYFDKDVAQEDDESEDESVDMDGGVDVEDDDSDSAAGVTIDLGDVQDVESEDEAASDAMDIDDTTTSATGGLKLSGFDWNADALGGDANGAAYESEPETAAPKKKKRKAEIKEDLTGDLDKYGPRSNSDFERQLLGLANDSQLWIQYMAFQLQLGEVQKARDIAERALRTIHIRETGEKMNIWIAWLNLEVAYGDDDRVEEVFKQACQVQDPLEVHEKMASILIDSGKHEKADDVFRKIVGNKTFRASPGVWTNYATFLMTSLRAPARARELLSRALQSVPTNEHRQLTAKFAALEFHSQGGDAERGRTIFEGLISEWPKWSTGWDQWVDLERAQIGRVEGKDAKKEAMEKTRALFERMAQQKMKKRRAKFVFKKWLEFEEKEGGGKQSERVKAMATAYVEKMQAGGEDEDE